MNNKLSLEIKEYNIKFTDIELNKLTLLTGPNGSGKSLVNISIWFANYLNYSKYNYIELSLEDVNIVFSNIFSNPISGKIILHSIENKFSSYNGYIEIDFIKGIVEKVFYVHIDTSSKNFVFPFYLSVFTRLFSNINHYIDYSLLVGKGNLEILLKSYKYYDISFIESLIVLCENEIKISNLYPDLISKKVIDIKYIKEINRFVVTYENSKGEIEAINAETLSNGEQAMIIMSLPSLFGGNQIT